MRLDFHVGVRPNTPVRFGYEILGCCFKGRRDGTVIIYLTTIQP